MGSVNQRNNWTISTMHSVINYGKIRRTQMDNNPVKKKYNYTMKTGRPLKYKPDQFAALIKDYFDEMDKQRRPYTITGMCLHLDTTRETLSDYLEKPEFTDAIKKAKLKVENYLEEKLITSKTSPIGLIFNLKNNFHWKDTHETVHSGNIQHGFVALPPLEPVKIEPIPVKTIEAEAKEV